MQRAESHRQRFSELVVDYNHVQICQCLAASKISKLSIIETALADISGGGKNNFA